jgi:hypothetical protein
VFPLQLLFVQFVDGADVLFQVGLALLSHVESELLVCADLPSAHTLLRAINVRAWRAVMCVCCDYVCVYSVPLRRCCDSHFNSTRCAH